MQEFACLKFSQFLIADDMVKELSSRCMLSNKKQTIFVLQYFIQLGDVRMSDFPQNFKFQLQPFLIRLTLNGRLLNNLDSHLLVGRQMSRYLHFIKRPLANLLPHYIILNHVIISQSLSFIILPAIFFGG